MRNEPIIIRNIEEQDYPVLISLFTEFAEFEKQTSQMINTVEKMQIDAPYINGFVAQNNKGEVVAYATCFIAYFTWKGKSMYMDDLYVKPNYRGQGLGTKLINNIIELAKQEKCFKLRWQVSEWNAPAIEFYRQLGAEISPIESNCDLIL